MESLTADKEASDRQVAVLTAQVPRPATGTRPGARRHNRGSCLGAVG
ncbi:MAG: hypothetical protein WDM96_03885 [Lacunisphaera sp.]